MPSGSRGSVRTTSGSPHGQRWATSATPRAWRPSCRETASRSACATGGRSARAVTGAPRARRRCGWTARRSRTRAAARRARPASGTGSLVPVAGFGVEHGVGPLPRLDELQPLPGLLLDVGRVAPPLLLGLEGGDVLLLAGDLVLQRRDVAALADVRRDGRAEQHHEERHDRQQHRAAAGAAVLGRGGEATAPPGRRIATGAAAAAAPRVDARGRPPPGRRGGRDAGPRERPVAMLPAQPCWRRAKRGKAPAPA